MGDVANFEEVREKRRKRIFRNRILKFLAFILFLIFSIFAWRQLNSLDVIAGVQGYLNRYASGPGYPIEINGVTVNDISDISGNPVLLTDTHINVYNPNGKSLQNIRHGMGNAFLVEGGNETLLAERGGSKLYIISSNDVIFSTEFEQKIMDADFISHELYGVVTSSKDFQGELAVYSKNVVSDYEQVFKWSSAQHIITDISLADDKNTVAACTVNTVNGVITSNLYIFNMSSGEEILNREFSDELVMDISFFENNILIITDECFYSINKNNQNEEYYDISKNEILAYDLGDDGVNVIAYKSPEGMLGIVKIDENAGVVGEIFIEDEVDMIRVEEEIVYIIAQSKIMIYNEDMSDSNSYELETGKKGTIYENVLYYTSPENIYKIDINVPT